MKVPSGKDRLREKTRKKPKLKPPPKREGHWLSRMMITKGDL